MAHPGRKGRGRYARPYRCSAPVDCVEHDRHGEVGSGVALLVGAVHLWTALVGFSGTGKTPGIDVTTRALRMVENSHRNQIAEMRRQHDTRVEVAKAANKKWKGEVQEAVDAGRPPPTLPPDATDPGPFVASRLYVSDITTERLAVLLQARPRGLSLIADELAGLFLNMGRYSNGSDRE